MGPANPWNGDSGVAPNERGGGPPVPAPAASNPPEVPAHGASANSASPGAPPADATMGSEGEEVPFSTGGTGTVDRGQLRKVLHGAMPSFVGCYQRALSKTPSLRGKFAARFRIEPDGAIGKAATTGPGGNPEFQSCVTDAIRGLQFPKPRGGAVEVVYPLTFEPG